MSTNKILLGTNWKMHKTLPEAIEYSRHLAELLAFLPGKEKVQLFVIPPFTTIDAVKKHSQGRFWVGAQNMHWEEWGPYTGEISAPMLRDLGVDLVELGHAERRQHFHETDENINKKLHQVIRYGFRPLLCVGERSEDKYYGIERETVGRQLRIALKGVSSSQASGLIIAYEPVWAIGEGGTAADAEYLLKMLAHTRDVLGQVLGEETSRSVPVLYGGTINQGNAADLLARSSTDGLFVGRAAWEIQGMARLIDICIQVASNPPGVHPAAH